MSLYGLEDVATNVTALSKLVELGLANTCVAEVVERLVEKIRVQCRMVLVVNFWHFSN